MKKGSKHTPEMIEYIRQKGLGRKFTQEHKDRIGAKHKGKIVSKETRQKLSEQRKGKSLEQQNHKIDCSCSFCKAQRGEYKGENHPNFGNIHNYHPSEETKKKISISTSGPKNHLWIDGRGSLHYSQQFKNLREEIILRDNSKCQGQDCTMTREEHLLVYDRDIEVHHIDYNKKNNDKINLTTLCKQCNIRANFDKKFWQDYYTKKVTENVSRKSICLCLNKSYQNLR